MWRARLANVQLAPGDKPGQTQSQIPKHNMSNMLVTLTQQDIKSRIATTNSFTKEEMNANRGLIVLERKNRRTELGKLNGSNVGSIIDQLRDEKNATLTGMVTRTSAKQQKWVITLTAKRTTTEAERLREKAMRLQKQLNKVEAELEDAEAPAANTTTLAKV